MQLRRLYEYLLHSCLNVCALILQELKPCFDASFDEARLHHEEKLKHRINFCTVITMIASIFAAVANPKARGDNLTFTCAIGTSALIFQTRYNWNSLVFMVSLLLIVLSLVHHDPANFFDNGYDTLTAVGVLVLSYINRVYRVAIWACVAFIVLATYAKSVVLVANIGLALLLLVLFAFLSELALLREAVAAENVRKAHVQKLEVLAQAAQQQTAALAAVERERAMERAYSMALQYLKTPLLLAKSEMKSMRETEPRCDACKASEQRIDEIWQLLTHTMAPFEREVASNSQRSLKEKRFRIECMSLPAIWEPELHTQLSSDLATWPVAGRRAGRHSLANPAQPRQKRAASEDHASEQPPKNVVGEEPHGTRDAAKRDVRLAQLHGVPIAPLTAHVVELLRHIPVASAAESREVLSQAFKVLLESPSQHKWFPCSDWSCNLCGGRNDDEDEFCFCCLCDRGMRQEQDGEEQSNNSAQSSPPGSDGNDGPDE